MINQVLTPPAERTPAPECSAPHPQVWDSPPSPPGNLACSLPPINVQAPPGVSGSALPD
jgi:hypothetical protein